MERIIEEKDIDLNVGKTLDAAKTITTVRIKMPESRKLYTKRGSLLKSIGQYSYYLISKMRTNDLGGALTKSRVKNSRKA